MGFLPLGFFLYFYASPSYKSVGELCLTVWMAGTAGGKGADVLGKDRWFCFDFWGVFFKPLLYVAGRSCLPRAGRRFSG